MDKCLKMFVLALEHMPQLCESNKFVKDEYNAIRVLADLFMSLLNAESVKDHESIIQKFYLDVQEKEIGPLSMVDVHKYKSINIQEVSYKVNVTNVVTFVYNIKYNDKVLTYCKQLNKNIYYKISQHPNMDTIVLSYSLLGFDTGHFWGLHPSIYTFFENEYTAPLECFASPFNNNTPHHFSLLPGIDNSKGNFFRGFLKDKHHDLYIINPPYIEDIMIRVMNMILQKVNTCESDILCYFPKWDDIIVPWLEKVKLLRHVHTCVLPKHNSRVYDYMCAKHIISPFDAYLVLITNKSDSLSQFGKVCKIQRGMQREFKNKLQYRN